MAYDFDARRFRDGTPNHSAVQLNHALDAKAEKTALTAETNARVSGDQTVASTAEAARLLTEGRLDTERQARIAAVSAETVARAAALTAETDARIASTSGAGLVFRVEQAFGYRPMQSFNGRSGIVTLLNTDVTTALQYSPYNATNPAGYQTLAQVTAATETVRAVPGIVAANTGQVLTARATGSYDWADATGDRLLSRYPTIDLTGAIDATAALNAVLAASPASGVAYVMPAGSILRIDGIVTVPNNCAIVAASPSVGHAAPNLIAPFGPRVLIAAAGSLRLANGARLAGLKIERQGLVWFPPAASSHVATQFLGTAITTQGATADVTVEDCMILGFEWAFYPGDLALQTSRVRIRRNRVDCRNGFRLHDSFDTAVIEDNHFWPYTTLGSPVETDYRHTERPGRAVWLSGANDWTAIRHCFIYNYVGGIRVDGTSGYVMLEDLQVDGYGTGPINGSRGITVSGTSFDVTVERPRIHGYDIGILVETTSPNNVVNVIAPVIAECRQQGVLVTSGRVFVSDPVVRYGGLSGQIANTGYGLFCTNNAAALLTVRGGSYTGLGGCIGGDVGARVRYLGGGQFRGVLVPVQNPFNHVQASADPLRLDPEGVMFTITGTTSFGTLNDAATFAGRGIVLRFDGVLTVANMGTMRLDGNFTTRPGSTLSLMSDGTLFWETSRRF